MRVASEQRSRYLYDLSPPSTRYCNAVTFLGYMDKWHVHVDLRWNDNENIKDRLRVYTYVMIVIFFRHNKA